MKLLYRLSQGLSIVAMLFFSIPKLTAQPPSVEGFTQFAEVLPVDPFVFMYFTGAMELSIVVLMVAGIIAEFKKNTKYLKYASPAAFFLLLGAMCGALLIEFFVRPAPEIMLVSIALVLIAGSVIGIINNKKILRNFYG